MNRESLDAERDAQKILFKHSVIHQKFEML